MEYKPFKRTTHFSERAARVLGNTDNASGRVNDIIDRYGEIVDRHRRELLEMFTDNEIMATASAIASTAWRPAATIDQGIAADVADCDPAEIEQWSVDQRELTRKLSALTFAQSCALIELIDARVWSK